MSTRCSVTVVVDAFRAFSTAAYVLERQPDRYLLAANSKTIDRLRSEIPRSILIGKPEAGETTVYDIPNSPARSLDVAIHGRTVLHRTQAGAKGVLQAAGADLVLGAAFVNAAATARYLRTLHDPDVTFFPMGHEAVTASLEDDLCVAYISGLLHDRPPDISAAIPALREGPGRYFFGEDQWQYPAEDFERCLQLDRFDFAIKAIVHEDYAQLVRG